MFAEVKWRIALHLCFKSMSRAQQRLFFFCRPCDREKTYPHYRERFYGGWNKAAQRRLRAANGFSFGY
jgi:hypothetical protein